VDEEGTFLNAFVAVQFNRWIAPPGTSFFYASIEADVVGIVVHCAVGHSLSDYFPEHLLEPISTEADAAWVIDAEGFEVARTARSLAGFFSLALALTPWRRAARRSSVRPRRSSPVRR
jgi:CubicO group peptidase (beta-lactamase class C family)